MTVLEYPIATEKAIGQIERNNVVVYVVDARATKSSVKAEFEKVFNVKVESINIINTPDNKRKASIKLKKGFKASDVATKLKLV
jgi:ribosomal protein L23